MIEPLESRESKKIRDFVIVIDTSESTSGELVKAFLKETFGLLKTGESFFAKCNIAVMQCDDAVRDLTFLHSTDELDRFAACLTLTGGEAQTSAPRLPKLRNCAGTAPCGICRAYFTLPMAKAPTLPGARLTR